MLRSLSCSGSRCLHVASWLGFYRYAHGGPWFAVVGRLLSYAPISAVVRLALVALRSRRRCAVGVVCDRAVQAATAFGANLSSVVIGHQKAEAVGCAHPSTADTVQRCVLLRVEGNSDEFVSRGVLTLKPPKN